MPELWMRALLDGDLTRLSGDSHSNKDAGGSLDPLALRDELKVSIMLDLKRITPFLCGVLAALCLVGCTARGNNGDTSAGGSKTAAGTAIPLTEEETDILEAMGEDVQTISDADYASTVFELQAHVGEFAGQVFQLEGVYSADGLDDSDAPFVYRTLVHDGSETKLGLPLRYLEKELTDGSWIRVTAIIGTEDYNGESRTVLEVVAVEAPAEAGQTQLDWDGVGHQH